MLTEQQIRQVAESSFRANNPSAKYHSAARRYYCAGYIAAALKQQEPKQEKRQEGEYLFKVCLYPEKPVNDGILVDKIMSAFADQNVEVVVAPIPNPPEEQQEPVEQEKIKIYSKYWINALRTDTVTVDRLQFGRTYESNGKLYCDECCNGDRCDDPTHRRRESCPYCLGTGKNSAYYEKPPSVEQEEKEESEQGYTSIFEKHAKELQEANRKIAEQNNSYCQALTHINDLEASNTFLLKCKDEWASQCIRLKKQLSSLQSSQAEIAGKAWDACDVAACKNIKVYYDMNFESRAELDASAMEDARSEYLNSLKK